MADIFISYSQKDREVAKALADFLSDCGYDRWWDYELVGGVNFRTEIKAELEKAKAAVVIWTPNSVEADWVVEEAEDAKHAKKLIATRVEALDYRSIPLGFRSLQTDLVTEPERILKALESIGVTPSHPPSTPKRGPVFIDKRLDAEAIAKAEQFAHWEFIKDSKDPASFTGFIEQFPTSGFARLARIQLGRFAAEAWESLRNTADISALHAFVQAFPEDARAAEAKSGIQGLQTRAEEARWQAIAASSDPAVVEEFLKTYPDSALVTQARARLEEIRRAREEQDWQAARDAPVPAHVLGFLRAHPAGAHAEEALKLLAALANKIEDDAWRVAKDARCPVVLRGFLAAFPNGTHANAAEKLARQYEPAEEPTEGLKQQTSDPLSAAAFDSQRDVSARNETAAISNKTFRILILIAGLVLILMFILIAIHPALP
jgi:hypothetical protein